MEIEKAIEIIKSVMRSNEVIINVDYKGNESSLVNEIAIAKLENNAMQIVIEELEKEREKNERLEKFIQNGEYTWKQKYNETFEHVKKEFVSKEKIEEKIEEFKNKIQKIRSKKLFNEPKDAIYITRYKHYIAVLQSLLEKECKNDE